MQLCVLCSFCTVCFEVNYQSTYVQSLVNVHGFDMWQNCEIPSVQCARNVSQQSTNFEENQDVQDEIIVHVQQLGKTTVSALVWDEVLQRITISYSLQSTRLGKTLGPCVAKFRDFYCAALCKRIRIRPRGFQYFFPLGRHRGTENQRPRPVRKLVSQAKSVKAIVLDSQPARVNLNDEFTTPEGLTQVLQPRSKTARKRCARDKESSTK